MTRCSSERCLPLVSLELWVPQGVLNGPKNGRNREPLDPAELLTTRYRVDQHSGIEDRARVERGLRRRERARELVGALAVVPRPVVAPDGVVVGDRPATVDDRVGRRPLDLVPLLELRP